MLCCAVPRCAVHPCVLRLAESTSAGLLCAALSCASMCCGALCAAVRLAAVWRNCWDVWVAQPCGLGLQARRPRCTIENPALQTRQCELAMPAGEVAALYHYNEAEHVEGPAVIGDFGELVAACRGWVGGWEQRGVCRVRAGLRGWAGLG